MKGTTISTLKTQTLGHDMKRLALVIRFKHEKQRRGDARHKDVSGVQNNISRPALTMHCVSYRIHETKMETNK